MNHKRAIETIAVVMVAVVLAGEVIVYTSGTDAYGIDASASGGEIEYSFSVRGSQTYSIIAMDNGGMQRMQEIYAYYDESFASTYEKERDPVGSIPAEQKYYLEQTMKNLVFRGAPPAKILSAKDLADAMDADLKDPEGVRKGLIMASGAFPETIYDGTEESLAIKWLNSGGRLYWTANLLGRYVAAEDGSIRDLDDEGKDYQRLFFGASDCLNEGDESIALKDTGNDLRYLLSLKNNRVNFGVDTSKLPSGMKYLATGYTDGTYSSIVFTEYGGGTVCVLAGGLSRHQWSDLAQIISSGICHSTEVVDFDDGSVMNGTEKGKLNTGGHADIAVYAYLGGYFPVYGRFFQLTLIGP